MLHGSAQAIADNQGGPASWFFYAGWPGEPALGPPAYLHRWSGESIPEAPITHHWMDSSHITEGVLTTGVTEGAWKLEASVFRGRAGRASLEPRDAEARLVRVLFLRVERVRKDELFPPVDPRAGESFTVGKLAWGGLERLGQTGVLGLRLGALGTLSFVPRALRQTYGDTPFAGSVFLEARVRPAAPHD